MMHEFAAIEVEQKGEDKELLANALEAMKTLAVTYIRLGRLSELSQGKHGTPVHIVLRSRDQLKATQDEGARLLVEVTRFLGHARDFLV
jgi:ADP-dependent phosphofructokinase/glucokinase